MNIKVKEPLYMKANDTEYVVRPETIGVERNKVVYFYDTTKTAAVGFSRDYCLENPSLFHIQREITDKEVSMRDVMAVVRGYAHSMEPIDFEDLTEKLQAL